jgi:transposase InsO family protein
MRFRFIAAEKARYPMRLLCRCLQVSRSGYYAWVRRAPSPHAVRDQELIVQLRLMHAESRHTYGRPRLHRALKARGVSVSAKRIARLMRTAHLRARGRRRYRVTTESGHHYPIAPNRLKRRFAVTQLNRVWAADITACWTRAGWGYLAVVLDLASRRVVGWAYRRLPTVELVSAALERALPRVRPRSRLLHHSDRGIQYASRPYQDLLARHGLRPSMSRRQNCWDNAPVESFFSTLKTELSPASPWTDATEAELAIADYVTFYNHHRLHSSLDYRSPSDFEARVRTK